MHSFLKVSSVHKHIILNLKIRISHKPYKIISRIKGIDQGNITYEIKTAIDCATIKKSKNKFYNLDPIIRILTNNINGDCKTRQRVYRSEHKII